MAGIWAALGTAAAAAPWGAKLLNATEGWASKASHGIQHGLDWLSSQSKTAPAVWKPVIDGAHFVGSGVKRGLDAYANSGIGAFANDLVGIGAKAQDSIEKLTKKNKYSHPNDAAGSISRQPTSGGFKARIDSGGRAHITRRPKIRM